MQVQKYLDLTEPRKLHDEDWPIALRRPKPLESMPDEVGVDIPYGFGATRIIFKPYGRGMEIIEVDGHGKILEAIQLTKGGETHRHGLIAHMHETLAEGILAYAYHYSALGGRGLSEALPKIRDFIMAEVPELFSEELPRRTGFVRGVAASKPVSYDPTKTIYQ
jgi:hypothetical protein